MNWLKKNKGFLIVLLLSFLSIKPLFIEGLFPMHDDTQVARVFEMGKALGDGILPVRWVSDLGYGYGYPIFNFYAPLAYYAGGVLTIVGVDVLVATKIMIGFGTLLAGVFMYLLAREFWGELGGIIAAIFYMYAPYHAVQIYVRGAVGELWAYAFIPLVFYGLYMVYKEQKWKYISIGSFGYAGVILSHNLTAMMLTPFLLSVLLVSLCIGLKKIQFSVFNFQFLILFFGLLLSSFYWIPAFFEMQFTNVQSQIGGGADFRDHFVCLQQLWHSSWGFGGSTQGCMDGLSFMVGKLHIIFVFVVTFGIFLFWKREKVKMAAILLSLFFFFLSCFLMLETTRPLWEAIPQIAYIQYPWRFLTFASFFSSFLSGAVFLFFPKQKNISVIALVAILGYAFFVYGKFFTPQTIITKTSADYTGLHEIRWVTSKISDEYMPKNFIAVKDPHDIVNEKFMLDKDSVFESQEEKTNKIKATVFVNKEKAPVYILLAHFPAWQILVDGSAVAFQETNRGYLVYVQKGRHTIEATFHQTPLEKIANILSFIGFGIVIIGIIYATNEKAHSRNNSPRL